MTLCECGRAAMSKRTKGEIPKRRPDHPLCDRCFKKLRGHWVDRGKGYVYTWQPNGGNK